MAAEQETSVSQAGSFVSLAQDITTITGNSGGAVSPTAGNINIVGSGDIVVTGDPGTHTLTITGSGIVASSFPTDSGTATPSSGVLDIFGTANQIATSGSGHQVTLALTSSVTISGTMTAGTLATSAATANLQLNGTTITASGSNANVDVDITTKGSGALVFRGLTSGFSAAKWVTAQADLQTTDATPTNIISIPVAAQEMVTISVFCNGFTSDFATCLGGNLVATAYRPTASNVAIVGAPSGTVNYTNLGNGNNITIAVDTGAQTLNVICTGVAASTYIWVATYNYMYLVNNL